MSLALYTIIFLGLCFFLWRNFMKNKEYAVDVAQRSTAKYDLELLDETVCLRKIDVKLENRRLVFYRVYSFDYNSSLSDDRFRGYIVIRNGRLDDIVISEFEKADVIRENIVSEQFEDSQSGSSVHNIINFDEEGKL
ncbi:DUF3301 domain-containing protein [Francisella philomiragia]|uniref:DUF3301 domain-containing protein n=1 Tax=Francisella philomiragia TaxID=28110 RepID=UPI0001AF7DA5|nr:DUF3301 domain-containing protein [Francisella philomiragia]AJI74895.1 hypothetical protein BZ13_1940 [Francisella philomiragia subsp. philomiragia ATCC 25015]EET21754.1 conserved hypothetical protein [Francisella philomiragia subsp. philomiragia ATCC 25015]MBK2093865.1 DUF3301 domain-containing protein [Francisella philomiragia]MBK2238926.1 DUF3301 domain-containing protein [Francisella philomiragia]MBK2256335.1 DUF3301 domain-containing protein [Francisella philomiragia]